MKLRLLCLFAAMLLVLSACSSEQQKESVNASENQSDSATSNEPTGVSEKKDGYHKHYLDKRILEETKLVDEIPDESVYIMIEADAIVGEPVITISAGDKKLYIKNYGSDETVLETNMKVFSYHYSGPSDSWAIDDSGNILPGSQNLDCYVEPSESYTIEGRGRVRIRFPGQPLSFVGNVREKIVVTRDTITLYGADKDNPDFKDREEQNGKKIIFAD